MNKVRSNASWTGLTSDQLKALDRWLFEEKQGYKVVLEKAKTQLRYQGSMSSLHRYFLRRRKERAMEEFREMRDEAVAINGAVGVPGTVHEASRNLLAKFLFEQLQRSPEDAKEALSVAKLMVQNDYNEVLRGMKEKDHEVRLKAMELAKSKFEFDMIAKGVKALPQLQRLAETMEDPDPTEYRERAIETREAMFGSGEEVLPVPVQEEARMPESKTQPEAEVNAEGAAPVLVKETSVTN
jgi:chaperonin cofactor prefoldin